MSTQDPDPYLTPGLDSHRTLPVGETPPVEGSISGISRPEPPEVRRAWGVWLAVLIVLLAVTVSVMLIGMVIALSS
ncbi:MULTISPECIES: DUF6480 family protein [Kitasatospora]|uniref:Uncharacterized protein n=1 Tax=Kitasatospora cystarginea TaxID=58350 RepID=A0ABP5RU18_9ACTN